VKGQPGIRRLPRNREQEHHVTNPTEFTEGQPPDGYVFVATAGLRRAHLSVSDEPEILPLCGATAESPQEFEFLPHDFESCPACFRIAEEASTRG
jgi:hypothetical protein